MNRETDGRLKEFFEREAGKMTAPDSLKDRIDRELAVIDSMRENEEHSERKGSDMRFKKRKLVLAAAAVMMIGSITCIAAGKMAGSMVGSSHLTEVREYSGLADAEKKTGLETGMPESFSNGYQFQYVNTGDGAAVDADGNPIPGTEYTDIFVSYEKDGNGILASVTPKLKGMEESSEGMPEAKEVREIGGVSVSYLETTMKVVPPDYELTEQDKKDMENPNFGISYGSDEVKVQEVHSMEWRTEDQAYSLVDITGTAGAEEMFSMAEEIIEGK